MWNITRQMGHILEDNSENKIPSAPRISVYISGLQLMEWNPFNAVSKKSASWNTYRCSAEEYLNTQDKT